MKAHSRASTSRSFDATADDQPGQHEITQHGDRTSAARKQQFTPLNGIDLPEAMAIPRLCVQRANNAIYKARSGQFMCRQSPQQVENQDRDHVTWMQSLSVQNQRDNGRDE